MVPLKSLVQPLPLLLAVLGIQVRQGELGNLLLQLLNTHTHTQHVLCERIDSPTLSITREDKKRPNLVLKDIIQDSGILA